MNPPTRRPDHPPIVLASSSPYRREILERLGIRFSCQSPDIDEAGHDGESANDLVRRLSMEKARAVASSYPDALVIGCDQVSEQDGLIIGKPDNHDDAVRQLENASGRTAVLHSGVALLNAVTGNLQCDVATVRVRCRVLSRDQIERYLKTDQPYNCCGSLKVEGLGITLLESIESDDPNAITGLPVIQLVSMLAAEGITLP